MNGNVFKQKVFLFEEFSEILINEQFQQKKIRQKTNMFYEKNLIKFLQKKKMNVVIISRNKKKYVYIIDPKNDNEIDNIVNFITVAISDANNERKIFIHTHGINGYKYDLINYFTDDNFIESINDKDIIIFFNNCSSMPFDCATHKQCKKAIKKQEKLINSVITAVIKSNNNHNEKNDITTNLILSGFSRGCILNTLILNSINSYNIKNINHFFLIEELVPRMKFVLEPFENRYKKLKSVISKHYISEKISLILIPPDKSNKTLLKHHPLDLMHDFLNKLNNDKEMQKHLYKCQYCVDKSEQQEFYKKPYNNKYVEIVKEISNLDIKYCPQKNKIW